MLLVPRWGWPIIQRAEKRAITPDWLQLFAGRSGKARQRELRARLILTDIRSSAEAADQLGAWKVFRDRFEYHTLDVTDAAQCADRVRSLFQKHLDGWPEAGWICLPFKCANPKFRLGRLGGDVDPAQDITLDYVNYHNSFVDTGVAVYDGERMESRVRLWSFDHYATESSLVTPCREARQPLLAARSTARPGKLPPTQKGIELSRKGVLVTAFGPNPDGAGTLLRVWEQAGAGGELTISVPGKFTVATPINLRGEKRGDPIAIEAGTFKTDLGAYTPASFSLE